MLMKSSELSAFLQLVSTLELACVPSKENPEGSPPGSVPLWSGHTWYSTQQKPSS